MSKRNLRKQQAKLSRTRSIPYEEPKPPSALFHYTTAAGLIGIVKEQLLFATHANYLNDTAELQILESLLIPQISAEFRDIIPRLQAVNAFLPGLMDSFGESIFDSEANNACRSVMKAIENVSPFYVTSFCMHGVDTDEYDHGLLSQWRGYGRGGFAIQFDEAELDKLTVMESERRSFQMLATRQVAYDDHKAHANLKNFEGLGASALGVAFRSKVPVLAARPDVAQILSDRDVSSYINAFITTVPFLKTARFREENEYRLVANATAPSRIHEDIRVPVKVHFRDNPSSGSIVPYIRLFEAPSMALPIRKVIVGPHRDQENQSKAARLLLDQYELDVPVVVSDTTLRS